MTTFLNDDFLLETQVAQQLYHEVAAELPIIDFHTHLSAQHISQNHHFLNLTEAWLADDFYKWRVMRIHGIDEFYITGDASSKEKFLAWAETVPYTLRNPMFHWTHLELNRYFGISNVLLSPINAEEIYAACNERLQDENYSCRSLLQKMNVRVVCTTDDPTDSLVHHRLYGGTGNQPVKMYPTWCPDMALGIDNPSRFNAWLSKLEHASGVSIATFNDFMEALDSRHHYFHQQSCRSSHHCVDQVYSLDYSASMIHSIFDRVRRGQTPLSDDIARFRSAMMYHLAIMNHRRGWVQMLHVGALQNVNTRLHQTFGTDSGFDCIADPPVSRPICSFLNELDKSDQLAKTILFNSNPKDNAVLATVAASFCDGSTPSKVQFGSACQYLAQLRGITDQLDTLSHIGLIAHFVGMITEARSFLSFPRFETFRRIFCNLLGNDIKNGLIPNDMALLRSLITAVCYENAVDYLGLEE